MVRVMRIAMFGTHRHDRTSFDEANAAVGHSLTYFEPRLTQQTVALASGFEVVCSFVNDHADRETLEGLSRGGIRLIALRSAGFNHVDLTAPRP